MNEYQKYIAENKLKYYILTRDGQYMIVLAQNPTQAVWSHKSWNVLNAEYTTRKRAENAARIWQYNANPINA
jgi:hypothetical protein